jgi:hypothetical protein
VAIVQAMTVSQVNKLLREQPGLFRGSSWEGFTEIEEWRFDEIMWKGNRSLSEVTEEEFVTEITAFVLAHDWKP